MLYIHYVLIYLYSMRTQLRVLQGMVFNAEDTENDPSPTFNPNSDDSLLSPTQFEGLLTTKIKNLENELVNMRNIISMKVEAEVSIQYIVYIVVYIVYSI